MVVRVRFNNPLEFIEELRARPPESGGYPLRITNMYRSWKQAPVIRDVSVVATYKRGDVIVRLEYSCGSHWNINGEEDQKVMARAEEVQEQLRQAAADIGLATAAGIYEVEVPSLLLGAGRGGREVHGPA